MKLPVSARAPESAAAGSQADAKPAAAFPAAFATAPQVIDASTTAHEVAVAELRRLLTAWHHHEPGARLGTDPEELHQLRVTTRRIDAVLGLFKRQLPATLVRARKGTKAVLRHLGTTRDLDVQLAELAQYCAGLGAEERVAAEPLRVRLEGERMRARTRMIRALDSEPTRRWLESLTRATAAGSDTDGSDRAMRVMPQRVQRRFRKLRKSVGKLRVRSPMDDYHQVRRRAKQLRYATECGALMFGKSADELLKALRRLQNGLGAHQDAYMAQNRLAALAADPASGLPPATLFLMGRLAEHHARITAQTRRTLARSWRKVRGRRWKALRARLAELRESAAMLSDLLPARAARATCDEPLTYESPETPAGAHASAPEPRPLRH
ncbi:MAG: CHAD domain-containing protein [Gammaproteobacteria bacterium]|nr:CHAD domain-containing protein [Gammaproteobacteria bacterium]